MDVLLSLKPKYAEMILSGKKTVELRKRWANKEVDKVWIYATEPVGKILGYFEEGTVWTASPKDIWAMFEDQCGVSYAEYSKYFEGSKQAVAIEILNPMRIRPPPLWSLKSKVPIPQSWRYIKEGERGWFKGFEYE